VKVTGGSLSELDDQPRESEEKALKSRVSELQRHGPYLVLAMVPPLAALLILSTPKPILSTLLLMADGFLSAFVGGLGLVQIMRAVREKERIAWLVVGTLLGGSVAVAVGILLLVA